MKSLAHKMLVVLEKIVTFLVDRRAWAVGLVIALMVSGQFFGVDQAAQDAVTSAFGQTYDAVVAWFSATAALLAAITKLIVVAAMTMNLVQSWTKRPPSGLDFKMLAARAFN